MNLDDAADELHAEMSKRARIAFEREMSRPGSPLCLLRDVSSATDFIIFRAIWEHGFCIALVDEARKQIERRRIV